MHIGDDRVGKVVLITGGTRSGKSTFGEGLLKDEKEVLYIATSKITDQEMAERVKRHKERRPAVWETHEGYRSLSKVIEESQKKFVLFECVGTMITNILFDEERDFERKKEQQKEQRLGYSNSRYSDRRRTESRTTKTKEKEIQQQRIR